MKFAKLLHAVVVVAAAAVALAANATPVSQETAMAVADVWAAENAAFGANGGAVSARTECDSAGVALWHQVSLANGGALFVATVEEIEPVIAALEKDPGELPAAHPLRAILVADLTSRLKTLGLYGASSSRSFSASSVGAEAAEEIGKAQSAKWARLKSRAVVRDASAGMSAMGVDDSIADAPDSIGFETESTTAICVVKGFEKDGPLTHWNQDVNEAKQICFNYYTPGNVYCGCVATAFGAILQWFGTREGAVVTKQCSYKGKYADYTSKGGAYDWDILPSNWGGKADETNKLSDAQLELLGRVAYDCGVGVNMDWNVSGSGVLTTKLGVIADAFRTQFGFKSARYFDDLKNGLDDDHIEKFIYFQNRCGIPVFMAINGHAVVACGYGVDLDGVSRTRVFLGWGGSGDAWYALPRVDTKATAGGGTYTSEIVIGACTLLGYDSDEVVPVVGHCDRPGMTLNVTLDGVLDVGSIVTNNFGEENEEVVTNWIPRTLAVDGNGYFATRISPSAAAPAAEFAGITNNLVTNDFKPQKTYRIDPFQKMGGAVGSNLKDDWWKLSVQGTTTSESGEELTELDADTVFSYLPNEIVINLLNVTVAKDFNEAIAMAQEQNKAILAFSGVTGSGDATNVLGVLYGLDDDHWLDDKFIYVLNGEVAAGTYLADGMCSLAVFDPYTWVPSVDRWTDTDGRISYNAFEHDADTNTWGSVEEVAASATNVIFSGYVDYLRRYSGAELTIAGVSVRTGKAAEVGELAFTNYVGAVIATNRTDLVGHYGLFVDSFTNGEVVVVTAPAVVTNEDDGVVWACVGWTTNDVAAAEVKTNFSNVAFVTAKYDVGNAITWFWAETAFRVDSVASVSGAFAYDLVSPASAWYPYGGRASLAMSPRSKSVNFYSYECVDGRGATVDDDEDWAFAKNGNVVSFNVLDAADFTAYYKSTSAPANPYVYELVVSSSRYVEPSEEEPPAPPAPTLGSVSALDLPDAEPSFPVPFASAAEYVAGVTNKLYDSVARLYVPSKYVDSTGGVWECVGMIAIDANAVTSEVATAAAYVVDANAVVSNGVVTSNTVAYTHALEHLTADVKLTKDAATEVVALWAPSALEPRAPLPGEEEDEPAPTPLPFAIKSVSLDGGQWLIVVTNVVKGCTYTLCTTNFAVGGAAAIDDSAADNPRTATSDDPIEFRSSASSESTFWRVIAQ